MYKLCLQIILTGNYDNDVSEAVTRERDEVHVELRSRRITFPQKIANIRSLMIFRGTRATRRVLSDQTTILWLNATSIDVYQ